MTKVEVVDFRFLTVNDDYDLTTYVCQADIWSRLIFTRKKFGEK